MNDYHCFKHNIANKLHWFICNNHCEEPQLEEHPVVNWIRQHMRLYPLAISQTDSMYLSIDKGVSIWLFEKGGVLISMTFEYNDLAMLFKLQWVQ